MQKLQTMSETEYAGLRSGADVTAADHHGDKVLRLDDGTYLKLFRMKRLITSARVYPYWRRFVENAIKLNAMGIPTLSVINSYDLPHLKRTAVHYDPLPGSTLRDVAEVDAELVAKLGRFLCEIHDKGVYLRSLHLGNVVLTPEDDLGLIDVADMKIRSRSLPGRLRVRNYYHMCRYEEDRAVLSQYEGEFLAEVPVGIRDRIAGMLRP